jgi:hypothetical protein
LAGTAALAAGALALATGGALAGTAALAAGALADGLPTAEDLAAAALAAALAIIAFFLFASCESFFAIGLVVGTVSALPSSSLNIPLKLQQPENA